MGKIRVKTLGNEEAEKKQKQEARLASEAKRAKKKAENKKLVKGAKGGERIVAVGPTEEEIAKLSASENLSDSVVAIETSNKKTATTETQKKEKHRKERVRSKNYQAIAKMVDKTKKYALSDALDLISKLKRAKFDETVELHINTIEKGISGNVTLPHGTGKKIRVAIADDELIAKVEKGKIDFDVLLSEPSFMPKLAKVAKFLGPRGLMPNPKSGTISNDPKTLAKKYEGGHISFKTESKSPIIHFTVGKVSYGEKKLSDNIKTMLDAVKKEKIRNVTLKSTMSPGIKIQL